MLAGKANKGMICLFLLTALLSVFLFSSSAQADQDEVDQVNRQIWNKGAQWWAAETSVSKLPLALRQKRLGLTKHASSTPAQDSTRLHALPPPLTAPAGSLNYVNYNYVTPVKDQGDCGSCWAFATTAVLESQVAVGTGAFVNLSEQVLVSCSGAGDCDGGYMDTASTYIQSIGLPLETCFPYTQSNLSCSNAACPYWQSDTYSISGWHWISNNTPTVATLKNALYTYGPLVVSLDVYGDFYTYSGGVYSHVTGTYQGGHAVELVGYDDSAQCFIVKNSWGTSWGESGFFRIAYNQVSGVVHFAQETIAYEGYRHIQTTCNYALSATSGAIRSTGGTLTVDVTANLGCSWTAVSNASWITVASGASGSGSGSGSGSVQLSVPSYTGSTRSGTVTIAGITYTVTQTVAAAVTPTLASDFGSQGLWIFNNGMWKQMSEASPDKITTYGQKVVASFLGDGIYEYDGTTLTRISSNGSIQNMVGADVIYVDSGGLWKWDGRWTSLSATDPKNMVISGATLYVDFSPWGLWQWNGTAWAQINSNSPVKMVASGTNLYTDYGGWGLWWWNGSGWSQLLSATPRNMAASGSTLYADLSPWGLWQWNGASWAQLNNNSPVSMVASGANLYTDYGVWGLWWWNGTTWAQLSSTAPSDMAASGQNLYVSFGVWGVWQWNGSSWAVLSSQIAHRIIVSGN